MSFKDIKHASRRLDFKRSSSGPWGEGKSEVLDGICVACGNYDTELDKNGYCRDIDCRRDRLINALESGEAMCLKNGTILWTPGTKCRI
jgi:hypothetical protein